jgi:hypothetical protein
MHKQPQNEADAILQKQVEEAIWRAIGFNRGDPDDKPGPLERKCAVAAINAIQENGHAIVPIQHLRTASRILSFMRRQNGADNDDQIDQALETFDAVETNVQRRMRPSDWLRRTAQ